MTHGFGRVQRELRQARGLRRRRRRRVQPPDHDAHRGRHGRLGDRQAGGGRGLRGFSSSGPPSSGEGREEAAPGPPPIVRYFRRPDLAARGAHWAFAFDLKEIWRLDTPHGSQGNLAADNVAVSRRRARLPRRLPATGQACGRARVVAQHNPHAFFPSVLAHLFGVHRTEKSF